MREYTREYMMQFLVERVEWGLKSMVADMKRGGSGVRLFGCAYVTPSVQDSPAKKTRATALLISSRPNHTLLPIPLSRPALRAPPVWNVVLAVVLPCGSGGMGRQGFRMVGGAAWRGGGGIWFKPCQCGTLWSSSHRGFQQ
jgi:hypothetical protein